MHVIFLNFLNRLLVNPWHFWFLRLTDSFEEALQVAGYT